MGCGVRGIGTGIGIWADEMQTVGQGVWVMELMKGSSEEFCPIWKGQMSCGAVGKYDLLESTANARIWIRKQFLFQPNIVNISSYPFTFSRKRIQAYRTFVGVIELPIGRRFMTRRLSKNWTVEI